MPAVTFRGDVSLSVSRLSVAGTDLTQVGFPMLGLGISATDWLQLDLGLVPLFISPEVVFASPDVGLTISFTDSDANVEAGFRAGGIVPSGDQRLWAVQFGFPLRFHAGDVVRVDTGAQAAVYGITGGGEPQFGLLRQGVVPNRFEAGVPVMLFVSPIDYFFIGAGTGFGMVDLTENSGIEASDSVFFPLGFGLGANAPVSRQALIDLELGFDFPYFLLPAGQEVVNTNFWQLSFTTSIYYSAS